VIVGQTAYDWGTFYSASSRDGVTGQRGHGKYVIVWRKEADGHWRMHLDIWNTSPALEEREVIIPSGSGQTLAGTVTIPAGARPPYAVAVTITGSGAHFRDGNRSATDRYRPFRDIAQALAGAGISTLRLDDRGVGGSTGNPAATDGDDVASDLKTAIAWLRARPDIDGRRIAVIGHSFGGVVAPMVAAADSRHCRRRPHGRSGKELSRDDALSARIRDQSERRAVSG
jgi:dipeptidyl aminopeptidase/acylaminoacyl peptidase